MRLDVTAAAAFSKTAARAVSWEQRDVQCAAAAGGEHTEEGVVSSKGVINERR